MTGTYKTTRVALVEPNTGIAEATVEVLKDAGYEVKWFAKAATLCAVLPHYHPDIVLLDGESAVRYDSWEWAATLRDQGCKVIMFTAHHLAVRELEAAGYGRGFVAGLAQPFEISELLTLLERTQATPLRQPAFAH